MSTFNTPTVDFEELGIAGYGQGFGGFTPDQSFVEGYSRAHVELADDPKRDLRGTEERVAGVAINLDHIFPEWSDIPRGFSGEGYAEGVLTAVEDRRRGIVL